MKPEVRRGFTLVELLVVVAIIGILIGILLPTLSGALAKAKDMHCVNNLGQHAKAVQQYSTANRNRITGLGTNWMVSLDFHMNLGQRAEARLCPNATTPNTARGAVDRAWTYNGWVGSIAINYHLAARTPAANDYLSLSQTGTTTPAFTDGCWYDTGAIGSVAWPANLSGASNWILDRHRKALVMSYCDGHAERVDLAMIWDKKWHRNYTPQGRQTNPGLGIK